MAPTECSDLHAVGSHLLSSSVGEGLIIPLTQGHMIMVVAVVAKRFEFDELIEKTILSVNRTLQDLNQLWICESRLSPAQRRSGLQLPAAALCSFACVLSHSAYPVTSSQAMALAVSARAFDQGYRNSCMERDLATRLHYQLRRRRRSRILRNDDQEKNRG